MLKLLAQIAEAGKLFHTLTILTEKEF